jgi:hypothetical protein
MNDLTNGSNAVGSTRGANGSENTPANVPADTAGLRYINSAVAAPADRRRRRRRRSLLLLSDIDRRTLAYRETTRLISAIESDLGGHENTTAAEKQMIQHAGVLGAVLADQEAKYLKGRSINVPEYCAVINAQRRLFETLGTTRRSRDVTPSLDAVLAED